MLSATEACKQPRFLRHVCHQPVPIRRRHLPRGDPVHQITPLIGHAQPQQQLHQRQLARARRTDHTHHLPTIHLETDIGQHRTTRPVRIAHALERERTHMRQRHGPLHRSALPITPLRLLRTLDKGHRLNQTLIGALHVLPARARPHQDQHHRAKRGRMAFADLVQSEQRAHEHARISAPDRGSRRASAASE